jgi:hypothetical protein
VHVFPFGSAAAFHRGLDRLIATAAAATAASATITTAASAATTTTVTTAASTATAAATTTATIFARTGFVHGQCTAVVLGAVDALDRRLGFCVAAHFHESEALAAARVAIVDHLGALHRPKLSKQLVKVRAGDVEAQITTIQFLPHRKISCEWKK